MLLAFLIIKYYLLVIKYSNSVEMYKVKKEGRKEGRGGGRNELADYIIYLFI